MILPSCFTISLDFELFYGVRDHRTIENYGANILGTRKAIDDMLSLFKDYKIHATWATVGMLFYETKTSLLSDLPSIKPSYKNSAFSPYTDIENIGQNEIEDPYHFGLSLIKKIQTTPFQEIGTHTYSHYYCLEEGQTSAQFEADIVKAIQIAKKYEIDIKSIIFPRNQFNEAYLKIVGANNITSYRGNETSWLYNARNRTNETLIRRSLRLLDTYITISGHHVYDLAFINKGQALINIPSSRFLRPYSPKLKVLEGLKLRRIKKDMLVAAKTNKAYHLWWHPHNFGANTNENIAFLKSILEYYLILNKEYGMTSLNMSEIAKKING